jgi:hypothetical protein
MPILEITPEMVGPDRTSLALSYLASVMLWPANKDRACRDEWMRAITASFIRDAINDVPAARQAAEIAHFLSGYDLALAATPLGVLDGNAEQPFIYGCLAGELFFAAIDMYATRGVLILESIKTDMVSAKRRKDGRFRRYHALDISRSSLENTVWGGYKHVSPLWASYLVTALQGDAAFPCRLGRLPDFLGVAKLLETAGLNITPYRTKAPLLDATRLWRIPDGVPLPEYSRLHPTDLIHKV